MSQITKDFALTMIDQCARGGRPALTIWELEQLARAWLRLAEAERFLALAYDYVEANQGGWCRTGVTSSVVMTQIDAFLRAADSADEVQK